jgi:hypothetical protein
LASGDIERAARAAFREPQDRVYANDYLVSLRANWKDAESRTSKLAVFILLVAVVGELVLHGGISGVVVAGVALRNSFFLGLWCPAIVAYLYMSLSDIVLTTTIYQDVHDAIMTQCFPAMRQRELDEAIYPLSPVTVSVTAGYGNGSASVAAKSVGVVRPLVIFLGVPVYLIVYFAQIFSTDHASVAAYLSLAATVALLAASAPQVAAVARGYAEWLRSW